MRAGLFLAASVSLAISLHAKSGSAPSREVEWLTDYAAARAEAARTGKPIFAVFRCQH